MSMLLELPEVLSLSLVSDWLHMGSVTGLDSAICNRSLRVQFLRILCSERARLQFPIEHEGYIQQCDPMLWIMRRKIAFSGMWITENLAEHDVLRRAYLRSHGKGLKWITFVDFISDDQQEQTYKDEICQELVRYCPNVVKLTTTVCLSNRGLRMITAGLPALIRIRMDEWPSGPRMNAFSANCRRLKSLDLTVCRARDDQMIKFVQNCPMLEEFSCEQSSFLNNAFVLRLAVSCPLLRNLYINGSRLMSATLRILADHCPKLEVCPLDSNLYTTEAVLYLTSKCPNLKRMCVFNLVGQFQRPTDAEIVAMLGNCRKLEILEIGNCEALTDDTLRAIGRCCARLLKLRLSAFEGATDAGMSAVARGCPKLQTIMIVNGAKLTDVSVDALQRHCPSLRLFVADESVGIAADARMRMEEFCRQNLRRFNVECLPDDPCL